MLAHYCSHGVHIVDGQASRSKPIVETETTELSKTIERRMNLSAQTDYGGSLVLKNMADVKICPTSNDSVMVPSRICDTPNYSVR